MHSSSAALLTGKYFTKSWSFLLHFTVCLSQWFFFCKLFTMICFLQPNPKVINAVLHSASSSQSSTIQTFIPEVLHSLLECGFSAFSWLHFVLSCVVKSCIWYLNGEHCKTTMLKGLLLFISLLCFHICHPQGCSLLLVLMHLVILATYRSLVLQTVWMQSPFIHFCGRWFYKISPSWSNVRNKLQTLQDILHRNSAPEKKKEKKNKV